MLNSYVFWTYSSIISATDPNIVQSVFQALSVNILPHDGPVRAETCKSLMFKNVIVNNMITVCIYWLKLGKLKYNARNKQYKIHLSCLLYELVIQLLVNILYLTKYKIITIYNIQLLGKYLYRTRLNICMVIRQTFTFLDDEFRNNYDPTVR